MATNRINFEKYPRSKKRNPTKEILFYLYASDLVIGVAVLRLRYSRASQGDSNIGCLSIQYVELGRQGYITCIFSSQLSEVYWYDDVSGGSNVPPIAVYRVDGDVKEGPGIESGEYDIISNGTLVITNVTVRYEKQYKVLACTDSCIPLATISVQVVVYPRALTPKISSCNDESPCTVSVTKNGHPVCQVDSARPHVELEWVVHIRGKDIHAAGQVSFSEPNSDGVTYKSIAVLNETMNTERLLAVYICRARWIFAGLLTERKVLFDYSDERNLLNLPLEGTVSYEINRRSELRCKVSNFSAIIWRKVDLSDTVETIGFMYEDIIHNGGEFSDGVILSSDGSLQFTSLQLHHEGTYACIYDNGKGVKGMQTIYLQVLVPPSPPYTKIKECPEEGSCFFRGNRSGSLTCTIHGVRPEVSLTWAATNEKLVTLQDVKTVIQNRGPVTDVSTSVYYELSHDIVCGTFVEVKCQVGHPISQIIQPYATTVIYADECTDRDDVGDERHSIHIGVVVAIAVASVCSLSIVYVIILYCFMKYFKRRDRKKVHQSNDCEVEDVTLMLKQPNGHDMQTSGRSFPL
ncbi:hypothetical protein HOLleu_22709 [Holothuria leucospilota]|uniref:Ig-like domain-containing protein n=1 Tax=Holothuria leucospilota TaxID=206669 RepID=A0A9Q1BZ83_HOLLE|nr:hypothetical protein HOLleu_22709 [Holothuria leucospilota]